MMTREPALATHEGELASKLQQEGFKLRDKSAFEVTLRVLVFECQKLQHIGVLDLLVGGEVVARVRLRAMAQEDNLIPRERGSLEELRLDLSVELTDRPAT